MDKQALVQQLKEQIIKVLLLEDLTPDDIDPDAPLFVEGLGLDSIDAIELILLMEKEYGVKVEDPKERRSVLRSVSSIADYLLACPSS
jgi:acyl carrier protein